MNGLLSHTEFLSAYQQSDFVLATQRQLIKDFGTAGLDFPEDYSSIPIPLDPLLHAIKARLSELNSTSPSTFSQLLYQIDIPETLLPDLMASEDVYGSLAEIVLKREAYKVFLRSRF